MKNKNGFTLIEILVAIILFSIIFFPVANLLIAESKYKKKSIDKEVALFIGQSEINKYKGYSGKYENDEYIVSMAGQNWKVTRNIVEGDSTKVIKNGNIFIKQYLTINVFKENDTIKLADFKILRETYK